MTAVLDDMEKELRSKEEKLQEALLSGGQGGAVDEIKALQVHLRKKEEELEELRSTAAIGKNMNVLNLNTSQFAECLMQLGPASPWPCIG